MKFNFSNFFLYITKIFWLFPFLAFFSGYFFLQFLIVDTTIQVPSLLGKNMLQATQICSNYKLNLRIIAEKEVVDVQPGIIVKQKPLAGKSIKPNQSIFIVTTKLPIPLLAPNFIQKNSNTIEKACEEQGIKNRIYCIETSYPKNECFGQMPLPGQPLDTKKMSTYISTGSNQLYLFPDFKKLLLQDVIDFLQKYDISYDVYLKDEKIQPPYLQKYCILNQKPLAGSFVQPNNKLHVQLQVF